jgi:hypothetical protein
MACAWGTYAKIKSPAVWRGFALDLQHWQALVPVKLCAAKVVYQDSGAASFTEPPAILLQVPAGT